MRELMALLHTTVFAVCIDIEVLCVQIAPGLPCLTSDQQTQIPLFIYIFFYKYSSLVSYYRRVFFQQEVSFSTLLEETWYEKSQLSKGHHLYSLYNGPAWICNSDLLKGCWLISHNSTLTHCSKSSPSHSLCSKNSPPRSDIFRQGYSHVRKAPHRDGGWAYF